MSLLVDKIVSSFKKNKVFKSVGRIGKNVTYAVLPKGDSDHIPNIASAIQKVLRSEDTENVQVLIVLPEDGEVAEGNVIDDIEVAVEDVEETKEELSDRIEGTLGEEVLEDEDAEE